MLKKVQNLSISQKLLLPILTAVFLFDALYTVFWMNRYANEMNASFETELVLSKTFATAPLASAVWDYEEHLAEQTLAGFDQMEFFAFARVLSDGNAFVERLKGENPKDEWESGLSALAEAEEGTDRLTIGDYVYTKTQLRTEDDRMVGELLVIFDQTTIKAEILLSYIQAAVIGIAVFVGIGGLVYLIARSVTKPLNQIVQDITRIRDGDLEFSIESARRNDELGSLGRSLEIFRENIIEKGRLQKQEEAAKKEREETERRLAEEEKARQQAAIEHERETQRMKELEEAALAAERQAAEEERRERLAEQTFVVNELAKGLNKLAQGNLRACINVQFADAYENLRNDYNNAVQTLDNIISSISDSADKITRNAGEISAAASDLSHRTEASAATLEETASALDELTSSVQSASNGAYDANSLVQNTILEAEKGNEIVGQTINAMDKIEKSSTEIAKIISVIDDIAFQTNLLALNAGVEAARAGDAGRGFAVVASEVRALAQRSSDAAREINQLISSSGSQVQNGVELVGQAGTALQTIVSAIRKISKNVSNIATSSKEQSTGIAEINTAMNQLDQTTQRNVAMFEETTAASHALNSEAERLSVLISRFGGEGGDYRGTNQGPVKTERLVG
ncbi:methyl-accepting chemotaxis protein [Pseudaestuariivita rosea]|uniref:methyl-accepting chemotaxis protein n=1 Tax=Pseudaestuariivita rosea TaxID=2763263 RepID=UPI001ABB70E8|nr:HAMP domain-containing methyl-accepting chemotaxis protein [Pseudaestuariivita rosea]